MARSDDLQGRTSWKSLLLVGLSLFWVAASLAHDGGFGHSRRTIAFWSDDAGWTIEYRLTLNADEALIELTRADADGDGRVSGVERQGWLARRATELQQGFRMQPAMQLQSVRQTVSPSLSQTFVYRLPKPNRELTFSDLNFTHKPGVVRIVTGPGLQASVKTGGDLQHAEEVVLRVSSQVE